MMARMEKLVIYTDGGARGNPGPAGAGAIVYDGEEIVLEFKKYLGDKQTNNFAEYEAVALVLAELKDKGFAGRPVEVRMDSKLVVEQISGNWKIKEPTLKPQAAKVHALLKEFGDHTFTYVPREENKEADRLVNEALDEAL
jgi:ribonuclease HI